MGQEQRTYPRFNITCSGLVATNKELQTVDIQNLSEDGIFMIYRHQPQIKEGDDLRVFFYYRGASTLCSLVVKVVRITTEGNHVCVGGHFTEQQATVLRVLEQLQQQLDTSA